MATVKQERFGPPQPSQTQILQKESEELVHLLETLIELNPESSRSILKNSVEQNADSKVSPWFKPSVEEVKASARDLRSFLIRPSVQSFLGLYEDRELGEGLDRLVTHQNWKVFWYAELIFVVLFLGFRFWRLKRTESWQRRLWARTWTAGVGFFGVVFVLPLCFLGSGYFYTLRGVFSLLWNWLQTVI